MTKQQFLARCPTILVSYKTAEGLICNAEAILLNHVHAAFDDEDSLTRASDVTCICGRNCKTFTGNGKVHYCENSECSYYQIYIATPNGNGHSIS